MFGNDEAGQILSSIYKKLHNKYRDGHEIYNSGSSACIMSHQDILLRVYTDGQYPCVEIYEEPGGVGKAILSGLKALEYDITLREHNKTKTYFIKRKK